MNPAGRGSRDQRHWNTGMFASRSAKPRMGRLTGSAGFASAKRDSPARGQRTPKRGLRARQRPTTQRLPRSWTRRGRTRFSTRGTSSPIRPASKNALTPMARRPTKREPMRSRRRATTATIQRRPPHRKPAGTARSAYCASALPTRGDWRPRRSMAAAIWVPMSIAYFITDCSRSPVGGRSRVSHMTIVEPNIRLR